jgi:hypothetical protein
MGSGSTHPQEKEHDEALNFNKNAKDQVCMNHPHHLNPIKSTWCVEDNLFEPQIFL